MCLAKHAWNGACAISQSGPITAALEEEMTRALRQRGMVVWLDKDGHYTTYVDALVERHTRGEFFAPVVPFRGSYRHDAGARTLWQWPRFGAAAPPHARAHRRIYPPHPHAGDVCAGFRFRKALATLIREVASGRVGPAEIEHYLASGSVSLEAAEAGCTHDLSDQRGTGQIPRQPHARMAG